jgi:hypothetical protein
MNDLFARRRTGSQSGYALIAVVLMIGLTSLGVSALLGLVFTATATQAASAKEERELRSLESALDTVVNHMRFNPETPTQGGCDGIINTLNVDNGPSTSDDVPVTLTCKGEAISPRRSTSDQVRLVGADGYPATGGALSPGPPAGESPWTGWPWPSGILTNLQASGTVPPNLLHQGPAPLRFGSGVTVRNGSAGLGFVDVTRRATGGTGSSLADTTRTWTANQWRNYDVRVLSGPSAGTVETVTGNNSTSLFIDAWVATPFPNNTSVYTLLVTNVFGGQAASGTTTTLTDNLGTRDWTVNRWAGFQVRILSGAGAGQVRTIASNTATALTVDPAWTTTPTSTSAYAILPPNTPAGVATSGAATTLTDTTRTWVANEWAGYEVRILTGAGAGQFRTISSNTSTALTVGSPWAVNPTSTSTYAILPADPTTGTASAGRVTAGETAALTDSTKSWTNDQWVNYPVRILSGTGAGQIRNISSNTTTRLTVDAAWTTPPDATSYFAIVASGSAMEVSGDYIQGATGPGAASGCGPLSAIGPMRIRDQGGSSEPQCGVSAADLKLDLDPTDAVAGFPRPTDRPEPRAPEGFRVPEGASACSPAVIQLNPGRYNSTDMRDLNRLLDASSSGAVTPCTASRTFLFNPGVYVFTGEQLGFNRPGSFFVMGEPEGWTTATGVQGQPALVANPNAALCKSPPAGSSSAQRGVTFVLPPQFRIRHTAGRLSMCPERSNNVGQPALPAIYQETAYENRTIPPETAELKLYQPSLTPFTCFNPTLVTNPFLNNQLAVLDGPNTPARPTSFANAADRLPAVGPDECRVGQTFSATVDTVDPRPLTSARLQVRGYESVTTPANFVTDRRMMVTVRGEDGNRICTTSAQPGIGNGQWAASINLLTGSCAQPRLCTFGEAYDAKCRDPRTDFTLPLVVPYGAAFSSLLTPGVPAGSAPPAEQALTSALLADAQLEVTQYLTFSNTFAGVAIFPQQTYTLDCGPSKRPCIELVTNGVSTELGTVTNGTTDPPFLRGFDNLAGVTGSGIATPQMPDNSTIGTSGLVTETGTQCQRYLLCPVVVPAASAVPSNPFVHELNLGEASVPIPSVYRDKGIDPNLSSLNLRLRLVPDHCPAQGNSKCQLLDDVDLGIFGSVQFSNDLLRQSYFGTEVKARIKLTTNQGTRCVEATGTLGSTTDLMVDLMDANRIVGGTGCNDVVIDSMADLRLTEAPAVNGQNKVGLSVQLQQPCLRDYFANASWRCVRWTDDGRTVVFQVRPPSIDDISLFVTSDSITDPPLSSRVTINARPPSSSSFNVGGKVWMPRSNLDVIWDGDVTEGVPLVQDELVVGSLGSWIKSPPVRTSAGIRYLLCCRAENAIARDFEIVAQVAGGGGRSLYARVYFDDRDGSGNPVNGYRMEVRDWQSCDEGREVLCQRVLAP